MTQDLLVTQALYLIICIVGTSNVLPRDTNAFYRKVSEVKTRTNLHFMSLKIADSPISYPPENNRWMIKRSKDRGKQLFSLTSRRWISTNPLQSASHNCLADQSQFIYPSIDYNLFSRLCPHLYDAWHVLFQFQRMFKMRDVIFTTHPKACSFFSHRPCSCQVKVQKKLIKVNTTKDLKLVNPYHI